MAYLLHPGYFPSCTSTRDTDVVEGGLPEVMSVFWRVRAWELSVFSGALEFESGSPWIFDVQQDPVSFGVIAAQREQDLVCGSSGTGFTSIPFRIPPDPLSDPPGTPDSYGSGEFAVYYDSLSSVTPNGTYQLTFRCSFRVAGGVFFLNKQQNFLESIGRRIGSFTFLPMGVSADIYGLGAVSGGVNIEMSAKQWWSYGETYDTATGERL